MKMIPGILHTYQVGDVCLATHFLGAVNPFVGIMGKSPNPEKYGHAFINFTGFNHLGDKMPEQLEKIANSKYSAMGFGDLILPREVFESVDFGVLVGDEDQQELQLFLGAALTKVFELYNSEGVSIPAVFIETHAKAEPSKSDNVILYFSARVPVREEHYKEFLRVRLKELNAAMELDRDLMQSAVDMQAAMTPQVSPKPNLH